MKKEQKNRTVAIAGHWNPIHIGHLKLIKEAGKLGDSLIVIVANDNQAKFKRSKIFMSAKDRVQIMKNIKGVDKAVLSVDNDHTVCNTLELLRPDIFASGCSSSHKDAVLEREICLIYDIKTVFDVGGRKIRSSSKLLKEYASK